MDEENQQVVRRRSRFSKSFSIRRGDKATNYEYVNNFHNTSLKRCKKIDRRNSDVYDKNCKLYNSILTKMEKNNALFEIRNPPQSPRSPTNEEYFLIHEMRNKEVNNKLQTMAITYLTMNHYNLVIDPPREEIDFVKRNDNKYYEPYMAVDLARKIAGEKGEMLINVVKERYKIKNERENVLINMSNESNGELQQVSVPLRGATRNRYHDNRRQVTNLDSLCYPPHNSLSGAPSAPQPSAPPPLPMPSSPNNIYPMLMEDSNMSHKHIRESFGNDFNNLETESVISAPPSYNGVMTEFLHSTPPTKPERKKKGVSIVINNQ